MLAERIGALDCLSIEVELIKDNLNAICHFAEEDGGANYRVTLNAVFAVVNALERVHKELNAELGKLVEECPKQEAGA